MNKKVFKQIVGTMSYIVISATFLMLIGETLFTKTLGLALLCVAVFACIQFAVSISRSKKVDKATEFIHDCEPDSYINAFPALLAKHGKNRLYHDLLHLNLSTAHFMKGDYATALSVLNRVSLAFVSKYAIIVNCAIYNSATINYEAGNRDLAVYYYEMIKQYRLKLPAKTQSDVVEFIDKHIGLLDCIWGIEQGDYATALVLYQKMFEEGEKANNLYIRVAFMFSMSRVYGKMGDLPNQTACLQYTAAHGKYIYIAQVARDMLNSIEK
ncbi:MAG: hypothetical protein FWG45_03775 [Oscillospiraceae bacterium]|nr:hypothetical protein [Oscillospiraceae bacterium]